MSRLAIFFLIVVAPALSICLALLGLETLSDNLLGWFLLVLGIAYPAGGVIYYIILRKPFWRTADPANAVHEETSDLSFWLIIPGFIVVFFGAPLEWMNPSGMTPHLFGMQIAGLGLILCAVAVRIWTRLHIRGLYSGHLEVLTEHNLVQTGPYRYVRHPGYSGFLLMTMGVAIGYSSLIGLAAIVILLTPGLAYRIKVEERLLVEQFGEEYRTYMCRSKKMIPGIW